ncbi:peptidylprolyl isomerase [Pseudidiomarina marina]|uniref:Periplasmic chaperone PpiD n=1 Tax=Pseudidiomarina marina TaxID=502366 RepID=A0A432YKR7_9GAMM|nr:peptidylprolyl isomerase [Pseudidiomarina marina]PHR66419.1 MAG: peptidylprolyl isomerase [Idiomarina sp.]RUO61564.1 peptidylprolyl isomerase [Pseudidiomarina marina]
MLDRIREGSQSFIVKAILVLIALTFALAGIGGYITNQPEPSVAVVNGEEITRVEFDRAVENERARQQEQFGDFYATLAADPGFNRQLRQQVLDDLINQKLVEIYSRDAGLRVSDEQVKAAIREISAFQVAGQFDNTTYQMTLSGLGYTPDGFAELMRRDLARTQLLQAMVESEFTLPSEAAAVQRLVNQKRSGAYTTLELDKYIDAVEVADAELEQWYQENQQRFNVAEQVKVEFVQLDADVVAESVEIDERVVREWYDNNQSRYQTDDRYRFAHILIEGEGEAAEKEAQEVLTKLTEGADFAELAAEYSDDIFTAEAGGDLDFIEEGTMDPAFDEAAFALENVGDITGVVSTSFGYHIIKLTDIEEGSSTSFEEVRDEIVAEMRDSRVKQAYYELQQKVSALAFDIPDTLQPVAEETALTVRQSDWFNRDSAPTALNHPAVMEQLFNRDFIDEGLNSDLIEVNDKQAVVARVVDYKPASTKSLDEVRAQVLDNVRTEKAQAAAREDAEAMATQLRNGESLDVELIALEAIDRRNSEVPRAVVQSLFEQAVPAADSVQVAVTELNSGALAVVQLTDVMAGEVDDAMQAQMAEQLTNSFTQQSYGAFIEALREEADIEIRLDARGNTTE